MLALILASLPFTAHLQEDPIRFAAGAGAGFSTPGPAPFWMRSDQYGNVPPEAGYLSLMGSASREYRAEPEKSLDWGASVEGILNVGQETRFLLLEGYARARLAMFEVRAGRSKEVMGLCDTSLSSGSFAIAGNALGIPKVEVSIPEYWTLPILGDLFAFKGNFAHGWIGTTAMKLDDSLFTTNTYLHQKSLYGRFGKPGWALKLYGGFNHQAFWGHEQDFYGPDYTLTGFKTYLYVVTGTPFGNGSIPRSKVGNHLGSIDLGVEYTFSGVRLFVYRQNLYDVGALYYLANIRDGLNGVSLVNLRPTGGRVQWKKILFEFFYTKNQAGELWSPDVPSGDEDYYNNYLYVEGWSYMGLGLGNPFICTRQYTREGLAADPGDHFINNRVVLFHGGLEGSVMGWDLVLKASYSRNYGTFGTSEPGHSTGDDHTPPIYGIFGEKRQFSGFLETGRSFGRGLALQFAIAFDAGDLYYDAFGIRAGLVKTF